MRRETNPTGALITGLAFMTLGAGPLPAHAHGGPPSTYDVLLGSGSVSLVTSHGFFSEDADWAWICEEATSADLAPSSVRTPSRWLVGTSEGLNTSVEGCDWTPDPGLEGAYILRVMQDILNPERAWVATQEGVWLVDGGQDAVLEMTPDLSLRHMGQRADGTLLLVGFEGSEPTAVLGDQRIPLPAKTGRIEVVSSDLQGRFYVRFPAGFYDRLIRVSEDSAEVVLESTDMIHDVQAIGEDLYVLYRDGVAWSSDDGATWSEPVGEPITCLREGSGGFYACPPGPGPTALLGAPSLDRDPASWIWETALHFSDVTTNTCPVGTTAGNQCPYLWRIAGEELGAITTESEDNPQVTAATSSGCGAGSGHAGPTWLTILLVCLGALEMRSAGSRARRPPHTSNHGGRAVAFRLGPGGVERVDA